MASKMASYHAVDSGDQLNSTAIYGVSQTMDVTTDAEGYYYAGAGGLLR